MTIRELAAAFRPRLEGSKQAREVDAEVAKLLARLDADAVGDEFDA